MEEKEARIFVSAVNSLSKKLEHYGDADISNLSLLKLIYKYVKFCTKYSTLQRLDTMVAELQRTSPHICLEQFAVNAYVDSSLSVPIVITMGSGSNQAPTLTAASITLTDGLSPYTFTYADIFSGYSNPEGGVASAFVIKTVPSNGTLLYNGNAIAINTLYIDPTLLTYVKDSDLAYGTSFTFSAYDNDVQIPLESNVVACTVTVEAAVTLNSPATVGDRAQYAENRSITIFTVADFTTKAIAPYFDPEANALDAIRIDEISTANTGVYYYLGTPVVAGQVITNAELASGAFYHTAPDANAISTDSFNASVRDTGSMIWVQ